MKTKTIFKTLALAMMMPAMLLTTACSSDDDSIINNENINKQNTAKKGYALPVTVKVTRQGDNATTRATYDANEMKLSFSEGDQLFVKGEDNSDGGAGQFAGLLSWQSGGTFSGTITTENPYSGTADQLFTEANDCNATLLPSGYDDYDYITYEHEEGYDDHICIYTEKAFALTKKAAIEQFSSMEKSEYNNGFELEPRGAILNFNIIGLEKNKEVDVIITNLGASQMEGKVTTDETGCATFAIGIYTGYIHETLNNLGVSVGGYAIYVSSSHKSPEAGRIYNVTRSVASTPAARALSEATTDDIGKIAGADGNIYDDAAAASAASTTAVAMITYVGEDTYDDNYKKGLAITLADESSTMNWSTAKTTCEGKTAVTGAKWCLPSDYQWYQMLGANGGEQGKWSGLNTTITSAGGTGLQSGQGYWTSSEAYSGTAYYLYIMGDVNSTATILNDTEDNNKRVRACLVF